MHPSRVPPQKIYWVIVVPEKATDIVVTCNKIYAIKLARIWAPTAEDRTIFFSYPLVLILYYPSMVMSLFLACDIDLLISGNHRGLRGSVLICHPQLAKLDFQ